MNSLFVMGINSNFMKRVFFFLFAAALLSGNAQSPLEGTYREYKPGFYEKEIRAALIQSDRAAARKHFSADLSDRQYPVDPDDYTTCWHSAPHSQGATGTCWCFATVSFLESEAKRMHDIETGLSEMYIVYWEYVERARAFVENRGDVYFAQGSEAISVLRIMKKYGIVTREAYPGLPEGKEFHDHSIMTREMKAYLEGVKESNAWNTVMVVSTIREILNSYMGAPPMEFEYKGEYYSPLRFMGKVLKIDPDDYFSFMSTMSKTYNEKGELVEPDNWWHCDDYYNVRIADFMRVIDDALDSAYTVCICGDISEPGFDSWAEAGVVPDFDIPSEYINESAREMRLANGTTTDDHCMHIVGMTDKGRDRWYLFKDSGAGGFNGPNKGYRFVHEDYIRLKMMNIMIYKEAGRSVLDEIIK